jgi:hypothetical protein
MNEMIVYDKVNTITIHNIKQGLKKFELYVDDVEEYDDEIRITTPVRVNGLAKGQVGDMYMYCTYRYYCSNAERKEEKAPIHHIENVVLKTIQINSEFDSTPQWTYVFVKL